MSEATVEKAVRRLREAVDRGSAYEGLQTAKSVYHRCRSKRQYEASYDLAQQGAQVLLNHGDITAGVELAKMLTEAYTSDNVPASPEATQRLLSILDAAQRFASSQPSVDPSKPQPVESACQQLAVAAITWARGQEGGVQEAQRLHTRMGELIWSCRGWHGLGAAAEHYSRGNDLTAYAAVLAACIHEAEVETDEESWFLLRAVLHVLLASKPHPRALKANAAAATEAGLSRAASLLKAYREISSQELPSSPPIHLALLLFEVIQQQNGKLADCISRTYDPWLKSEPDLQQAFSAVTGSYLLSRQASGGGGLLGDLMQMLGNG